MKRRINSSILLALGALFFLLGFDSKVYGQEEDIPLPQETPEKPPVKKQFTPAKSLNEALYLASRPDRYTLPYIEQAKSLLEQGADPKAADERGRTPLHWAVIGGIYADNKQLVAAYTDIAELLIGSGAEVNAEDRFGNSPMDYQERSPTQPILELLLEAGAQPGRGQNRLAQLQKLWIDASVAAKANDLSAVRAVLATDLPIGTLVPVKLTSSVSSRDRVGDPFEAVVSTPVVVDNRIVVPPYTRIEGTILYASKSPNRYERSQLVLDFSALVWPDGTRTRVVQRLKEIDNSRETVDLNRIVGVSYPNSALSNKKITWGKRLVGTVVPTFGYAMEAATYAHQKKFGREIDYDPGTDMLLEVLVPVKLGTTPDAKGWTTFDPSTELVKMVNSQPFSVTTKEGAAVDPTNLFFIGSASRVDEAFRAAGWVDAASLNVTSGMRTFTAVVLKKGYDRAPFSTLYISGRSPDLTFQKQLNTFAKRHHIRLWKVGTYQGKDAWLGAATHDIGMGIDMKGVKPNWYHTVDPRVDRERDKIMNDLMFGGKVKAYALVDRPEMPKRLQTPGGNNRDTDGRILVLALP